MGSPLSSCLKISISDLNQETIILPTSNSQRTTYSQPSPLQASDYQVFLVKGDLYLGAEFKEEKIVRIYRTQDGKVSACQQKLKHLQEREIRQLISRLPPWQELQLANKDLLKIQAIKIEKLKQKILRYICPVTLQVPREPLEALCCKNSFESSVIIPMIYRCQFCPACKKPLTVKQLSGNFERSDAIRVLRYEIEQTYPKLSDEEKNKWRPIIVQGMGEAYLNSLNSLKGRDGL